jgi:hypothetical protein
VFLEEPHFSYAFGRNTTRGQIRYGSAGELQARMRDVHFVGQYRYAHGFHFRYRLVHQRQ